MNRALLIAASVLLFLLFSTVANADYPETCDQSQREVPSNPHSRCKWVPDSMITSAGYVVEMEYPVCRHYIYLEGLASLPPGEFGRYRAYKNNELDVAHISSGDGGDGGGLSTTYTSGSSGWMWETTDKGIRIRNFLPSDGGTHPYSYHDFTVNVGTPYRQQFVRYNLPTAKIIFEAFIDSEHSDRRYPVKIGELNRIANINSHDTLAWSCYERLQVEKQRLENLDKLEAERIELEQQLLIHQEKERARIQDENIRIAQERKHAQKRLEATQQVSAEIDAANAAWLVELRSIRAIEEQIQEELNQRTLAAIESARLLKDEYIAIKTLQMEEARRRSALLNEWYAEALLSWQDFEDLANRTWAEISANENEVERVKGEIQTIQDSFDQTLLEIQQRIEQFNLEQQKDNS